MGQCMRLHGPPGQQKEQATQKCCPLVGWKLVQDAVSSLHPGMPVVAKSDGKSGDDQNRRWGGGGLQRWDRGVSSRCTQERLAVLSGGRTGVPSVMIHI